MRLARLIPLVFLFIPILEIATFIFVGSRIGILATIGLVIAAGLIGVALVRLQGLRLIKEIQADIKAGRLPAEKLLNGAMIAFAGLLFLLPGFLSDIAGLLFLLPFVRGAIIRVMRANMTVVTTATGETWTRTKREDGVVDLEPEDWRRDDAGSPWSGVPKEPPVIGRE